MPSAAHIGTGLVESPNNSVLKGFSVSGGGDECRRRVQRRRAPGTRREEVPAQARGGRKSGPRHLTTDHHHQQANRRHLRAAGKPRAKMAEPEARTTNLGSASSVFQFRVDYNESKQLPIGEAVCSDLVSAGEHLWRVAFYPRGLSDEDNSKYTSIFLQHMSKSRSVNAMFDAFMMGRDGKPSKSYIQRICDTFEVQEDKEIHDTWGWYDFEKITVVEKKFLIEGHITFVCTIIVIDDSPILVPPSDIGAHLGRLLEHTDGTDVSFVVEDEKFPAHRAVLAARSPVFRAQLFGSMAEATLSSIRLHDIAPATFKVMLRFIYTDELPREGEPGDTSTEMFQNLLAAADLYGLDRLKIICAHELWARVSVDTVAAILGFAETYDCQELKNKCIDFFVVEENFKQAMFTDGYAMLLLKFPLIIAELKKRVRA